MVDVEFWKVFVVVVNKSFCKISEFCFILILIIEIEGEELKLVEIFVVRLDSVDLLFVDDILMLL